MYDNDQVAEPTLANTTASALAALFRCHRLLDDLEGNESLAKESGSPNQFSVPHLIQDVNDVDTQARRLCDRLDKLKQQIGQL